MRYMRKRQDGEKEVTSHPGTYDKKTWDMRYRKKYRRKEIYEKKTRWRKRSYQSPWHTGNGTAEQSMET